MARWVNSMMVAMVGDTGVTWPLHSGQWLPQPAPEPVARTKAPHNTTGMLKASTAQAYRANPGRKAGGRTASWISAVGMPTIVGLAVADGFGETLRACTRSPSRVTHSNRALQ